MNKKIFISYSDFNRKEMLRLQKAIQKSEYLIPIVVANKRQAMIPLAEKVAESIETCDIIIPIITKESLNNQWINQEIGYAKAKSKRIIPIIEKSIINSLKGFINKELDLSYNYESIRNNLKKERQNFRKCYKNLILDIESEIHRNSKPLIKLEGNPHLYLREDNVIRYIPDRTTRTLLGYTYENVQTVSEKNFRDFVQGEKLPSIKKAQLLIYNDAIYVLLENKLHHIPDSKTHHFIKQYNKNIERRILKSEFEKYKIDKPLKKIDEIDK